MKQRTFPEPQAFATVPRPPIELKPVESSQIRAIGYHEVSRTLAITFNTKSGEPGPVYHHADIPPELYEAFMAAESLGKFHGQHIKQLPFLKFPADEVTT